MFGPRKLASFHPWSFYVVEKCAEPGEAGAQETDLERRNRGAREFLARPGDDVPDERSQVSKDCDDRLVFDNLDLVERYVHKGLCFGMRVRSAPNLTTFIKALPFHGGEINGAKVANRAAVPVQGRRHQRSVLVYDVQAMEYPEKLLPVPSEIWTKRADEPARVGAEKALFFSLLNGAFEFIDIVANDEVCLTAPCGGRNGAGDMIERGAQVVEGITTSLKDFFGDAPDERVLLYVMGLPIIVYNDFVRVGATDKESIEDRLADPLNVLIGPFGF